MALGTGFPRDRRAGNRSICRSFILPHFIRLYIGEYLGWGSGNGWDALGYYRSQSSIFGQNAIRRLSGSCT